MFYTKSNLREKVNNTIKKKQFECYDSCSLARRTKQVNRLGLNGKCPIPSKRSINSDHPCLDSTLAAKAPLEQWRAAYSRWFSTLCYSFTECTSFRSFCRKETPIWRSCYLRAKMIQWKEPTFWMTVSKLHLLLRITTPKRASMIRGTSGGSHICKKIQRMRKFTHRCLWSPALNKITANSIRPRSVQSNRRRGLSKKAVFTVGIWRRSTRIRCDFMAKKEQTTCEFRPF